MEWIGIGKAKDWFTSKEQFEFVRWVAQEFEAQEVRGVSLDHN